MDHRTNDQKQAISQAESFVLGELRKKYPADKWPRVVEGWRRHSCSEWIQCPVGVIEGLFKKVASGDFGKDKKLFVDCNDGTNLPTVWYDWKQKTETVAKAASIKRKLAADAADKADKRPRVDRILEDTKFKTS